MLVPLTQGNQQGFVPLLAGSTSDTLRAQGKKEGVKWYLVLLLVSILFLVGGCGPTEGPTEEPIPTPPAIPVEPSGYSDIAIPIEAFQS